MKRPLESDTIEVPERKKLKLTETLLQEQLSGDNIDDLGNLVFLNENDVANEIIIAYEEGQSNMNALDSGPPATSMKFLYFLCICRCHTFLIKLK